MQKTMYLSKSQSLIYAAKLDADNKLKDLYTNYLWNFGLLLALCLIIQIITHVTLSMHYTPNVLEGFDSVEYVAKEVNLYSLVKSLHTYTASAFFLLLYLHISRGSYYGSYEAPRTLTWTIATVIFILMMATAFLGYVLPYGQMSLWGATVITNLISAIPWIGLEPSKINLCVNVIIIFAQFYLFNSIYKGSYKEARTYKYLKIKSIKLFSFCDKYANLVQGLNKGFTIYFNIWSLLKKQVKSLFLKVRFDIFSPFFFNLILPNLLCFTIVLNIELFCLTINYTFKFFYLITIYHKIIITISPIYVMPILIGFVLYKFIQFICIIFSIIQSSSIVSALTFNLSIYYYPYLKKYESNNLRFFISIFILIFIMFYVFLLLFNLCVIINKFIIFMDNCTVYMSGRGRGELPDLNNSNESGPSNPNKRPFTEMEGASLEEENRKKRQKRKAEYNYLTLLVGLTDSSPSLDSINASFPDLSSNEKIYANNFNLEGPSNILSSRANLSSTPIIAEQSNTSSGNITTPSVIPEQNNSNLRNPLHSYYSRPHNSVTSSVNIPSIYTNPLHYNLGIPSANAMDAQPIDPQLIDPQLINPQLSSNTRTSTIYNPSIIPMQSNIGMRHVNPMNAQLSINTISNGGNVEPISITSAPNLTHSNTNISIANQSTINLLQRSTQNTAYTEQDIRDHISRINLPKNSVLDKPIFCHSVWHSKNVLWFVGDFSKSNLEAICKGTDLARCNIIEWSSSPKKLGIDLLKNQYTFMVRENRQGVAISDIGLWTDHILTNKSNRIERLDGNRVFIETYTKHRS